MLINAVAEALLQTCGHFLYEWSSWLLLSLREYIHTSTIMAFMVNVASEKMCKLMGLQLCRNLVAFMRGAKREMGSWELTGLN